MNAEMDRVAALRRYDILDSAPEPEFDEIVALASAICETPVALVSLVEVNRQWFKATVGFDSCETPLEQSVCAHAIAQRSMLVIPDLTQDQRTKGNTLVTEGPKIRFYAGALLENADGHILGTLCVIDDKPRPQGLTPVQAKALQGLARQVVALMEMRRSLLEWTTEESRYRTLFRAIDTAFCIVEMKFDAADRPVDYRFIDINPAFERHTGIAGAIGKWIRDLVPNIEQHWFDIYGQVARTGEPTRFENPSDALGRYFDVSAFRVGKPELAHVGILFTDITARHRADQRSRALLLLGDALRGVVSKSEAIHSAAKVLGETLDASRAGYAIIDLRAESATIEGGWNAPGVADISGTHPLSVLAATADLLKSGRSIVISDVAADPRFAADAARYAALGACAQITVPLLKNGDLVGVLFVNDAEPRDWKDTEIALAQAVADRIHATVARLEAEQEQQVLNQELSHRLKNTLAMVQAIATQTLRHVSEKDAVDAFNGRVLALSSAHDVLLQQSWAAARMRQVIDGVLGLHGDRSRFLVTGADFLLGPKAVLSLSLLLHELATNAIKHGALSVPGGQVLLSWSIEKQGEQQTFVLRWQEQGGPPASEPARRGFGSRLIKMGLSGTGESELRYEQSGLTASFRAPLSLMSDL